MTAEELSGILDRLKRIEESLFQISHRPPDKITKPMLRIADGVDWNPGAGAGLYLSMDGVTWTKL
jgi:hypothetical protein